MAAQRNRLKQLWVVRIQIKATISAPNSSAIFPSILLAEQKRILNLLPGETVDTLLAQIQKNQAQFMVLPLNMGANLYAKRVPLQLIGGLAHQTIFIPS